MKLKLLVILLLCSFFASCEETQMPMGASPIEFQENPGAQAAYNRLTADGTSIPSAEALNQEINGSLSLTSAVTTPPCDTCGIANEGDEFTGELGNYNNMTEARRAELVRLIMAEGPERHAKTTLDLPGGRFQVFNDALTLPDGTYVNFTYGEAREVARRWGCRLPNYSQAQAIRDHAEQQNAVYNARTRAWDNGVYQNMSSMMTDSQMRRRAEDGRGRLINGHFKWYIDDGSNRFRFFGFRAPPNCYGASSTGYCQNHGSSGGHGDSYIDYSQSVRLICPAR